MRHVGTKSCPASQAFQAGTGAWARATQYWEAAVVQPPLCCFSTIKESLVSARDDNGMILLPVVDSGDTTSQVRLVVGFTNVSPARSRPPIGTLWAR